MESIVVTGGAGYIGSHVVLALRERGFWPVVVDDLSQGHEELVQGAPLVRASVGDREVMEPLLAHLAPRAIIHLAASTVVSESVRHPLKHYTNNLAATITLIEAARRTEVEAVVFSSSAAVYGEPSGGPIGEEHPTSPLSPYGHSKRMVEILLEDCHNAWGLSTCALRYFNAAGAHEEGIAGEDHHPETHLIPRLLDCALGRRKALTIFGRDHLTRDGTCVRDYVHVQDLARAHTLALEHLLSEGGSLTLNLGTGTGSSVREVVEQVERITGRSLEVKEGARRPGDPATLVASGDRAREVLGWEPRLSDLENIVATAWQWHRTRFGALPE